MGAAAEKEKGVLVGAADVVKAAKRFANATTKGAGAGEVPLEACAGGGRGSLQGCRRGVGSRVPGGTTAREGRFPKRRPGLGPLRELGIGGLFLRAGQSRLM